MGKIIRVTPEELDRVSKKLAELSNTYTEIYRQLFQQTSSMAEAWSGEDNVAFVNQITGFTDELNEMARRLNLASSALNEQKNNYLLRQETNITQVKRLTN